MPRPSIDNFVDFDSRDQKLRLIGEVGTYTGMYEVTIVPRRNTRTLAQNAWYHGFICAALARFLSDQDYNVTTGNGAHQLLRTKFLAVDVVNKRTGEIIGERVRSTTELTTVEFSDYCERCRAWLLDFFGIYVPDPSPWEAKPKTKTKVTSGPPVPRRMIEHREAAHA